MRASILLVPLIMACTPPGESLDPVPAPDDAAPSARAQQDSVIRARVGEEFTIPLQANATTGYRWMLADSLDASLLTLVRNVYVADPNPERRVGAGGREEWVFAPLAPGETSIWLRYARSAGGTSPREAVFRVVIRPAQ